jgi:uncharacterized protein DUF4038/concanavalin A-like lectin/glucanase superfamily protein/collagenase-like protein with putative collagen-binding domain/fibronectin type III domain protein
MRKSGNDLRRRLGRALSPRALCRAVSLVGAGAALALVLAPAPLSATRQGLVAAYGFEEAGGSTVVDQSGNGNDGQIVDATRTSAGVFGGAISLDGSGVGVDVPDSMSLHLKRGMTLEAWVKPSAVSKAWRDVIYKGNDIYYLEATSAVNGSPAGGNTVNGDGDDHAVGTDPLEPGAWAYLAVTYDGSAIQLYVNGDPVASIPQDGTIKLSSSPLEIGGDGIYGQYFQGLIDEVRVYNIPLTAGQIEDDMNTPVVDGTPTGDPYPPSEPGTLTATAAGSDRVDLSWGAASDNKGVTSYDIERCQGDGCTDFTHLDSTPNTTYTDTSAAAKSTYAYRVRAVDAAGNVGPYSNIATATTSAPPPPLGPGPIRVGPTGRYLVDQNGAPFLITGDSPQAIIGDITESDAAQFFASRQALGFNTVWINLLCNHYTGCADDGSTWDGIPPFTTPGDFSTPNEAYFAHVDRIIRLAGQYGLVVILDPAETGGWLDTMIANGVDKLRAYGQYLGRRYKDFPNIIWMSGNDYQNWGPTNDPYVTAVALGIADEDSSHLQTVELDFPTSGSLDDPTWAPIIQLNASYTYEPTYEQVLADYNRSNFLPTFMVEASYEFEANGPPGTPLRLRQQEYWSLLSGAAGQLYGNHYTWQFICQQRDASGDCIGGWKDQLDTPGQAQMPYLESLFESRPWYNLVPDQAHAVVTAGYGTFGQDDYVTAARTPDGTLALAYVPSSRTVTVDMSSFSGPVTARWYDPTAGTFTSIDGSPFPNTGSQDFTTPGPNAGGDGDWVLVLEVH